MTPEKRTWIGRPGMVEAERVAPREWRWRFVGLQRRTWFYERDAFACALHASWACKRRMCDCDWRLAP